MFKLIAKKIDKIFAKDLAIDMGTANFIIYEKKIGIKLNQPSVVALIDNGTAKVPYLFGSIAKKMIGRSPANITIVKPIRGGAVADFYIVEEMISHFVSEIISGWKVNRPKLVIAIPYDSTTTEKIAIQEASLKAGAREVFLVYEPIAAAIGANLSVGDSSGCMVVDIGGGTSEIAIMALGGIVRGKSIKIAGDRFTEAIIEYVSEKYNLLIGYSTAENIKETIGAAFIAKNEILKKITAKGRDFITGIPKEIEITQEDVSLAISSLITELIKSIKDILDSSPPELASDIADKGIVLTGGSSQLKNLDKVISDAAGVPVFLAHNPIQCVANGLGKVLDNMSLYSSVIFKQF